MTPKQQVQVRSFFVNTTATRNGAKFGLTELGIRKACDFAEGEAELSTSNLQNIWKFVAEQPGCAGNR